MMLITDVISTQGNVFSAETKAEKKPHNTCLTDLFSA